MSYLRFLFPILKILNLLNSVQNRQVNSIKSLRYSFATSAFYRNCPTMRVLQGFYNHHRIKSPPYRGRKLRSHPALWPQEKLPRSLSAQPPSNNQTSCLPTRQWQHRLNHHRSRPFSVPEPNWAWYILSIPDQARPNPTPQLIPYGHCR